MIRRLKQQAALHRLGALACSAVLLSAAGARADQVTSKGTVLHGKITALSPAGITFEPEYGKGTIAIKWEDIEDLNTDGNVQVLYGEDEETDTPLQGFSSKTLFTGPQLEGATRIDIASIHSGVAIGPEGEPISAKLSVLDEYDNTPAPDTDRNSLFIAAGLSLAS